MAAVDRLGIVVEQQQRIRLRVQHLCNEAKPFRGEIVAFVDEDGPILGTGDKACLHAMDHGIDVPFVGGLLRVDFLHVVGFDLFLAPAVEVLDRDFVLEVALLDERAEPRGQGNVEAEDQDGFVEFAGQLQAAVAENEGFARTGDPVDNPVSFAQVAGHLFLDEIHGLDEVWSGPGLGVGLGEKITLHRGDADFGKEVPTDAIDLGQA